MTCKACTIFLSTFFSPVKNAYSRVERFRPKMEDLLLHEYITGNRIKVYAAL